MQYDEIERLREQHASWALLRSPHAALTLSFLDRVFVKSNSGGRPADDLVSLLDDELYALNNRLGEDTFKRSAQAYLDDWAAPERGWLRKYYPVGSDVPHYDITPPVEKALLWLHDLRTREVIGTESRLSTLFELLRPMIYGAEEDTAERLAELRRRRAELRLRPMNVARTFWGDQSPPARHSCCIASPAFMPPSSLSQAARTWGT